MERMSSERTEADALRQYYAGRAIVSPEGVLRVLSVLACIAASVLYLGGGGGGGGGCGWAGSAGYVGVACAALCALLSGGAALLVPRAAPHAWLYTELVLSSAMGAAMLVMAACTLSMCDRDNLIQYLQAPVTIATGVMLIASAVITYIAVVTFLDGIRGPKVEPIRREAHPKELDV